MKSLRAALVFIGFAGLAVGLFTVAMIYTSDRNSDPLAISVVALLIGWSFIGTGLFAWWRRPMNRTGGLMTAVGFTWFFIPLSVSDVPAVFITGVIFGNLVIAMLAQLTLSFPSGRLDSRFARWIVGIGYFDAVVLELIAVLFVRDPSVSPSCATCPRNPLAVAQNESLFRAFGTLSAVGGVILISIMIVILVRRWRSLEPAGRAAVNPVAVTGGVTLVLFGAGIAAGVVYPNNSSLHDVFTGAAMVSVVTIPFAFLFGLLRARFTSAAAVSELIEKLGDTTVRDLDIRDALADALGDPTLEFAYWLPADARYVDADGRTVELPENGSDRGFSTVEHDGELVAAIVHDGALADRETLIRSAGAAASLALRNQRLDAELRAKLAELRASRLRIVQASDDARRKLERDLHDGAQQHLVSMALNLRLARDSVENDPRAAVELIEQVSGELAEATAELRELARGIHPAILSDRGLKEALDALAARAPVEIELEYEPTTRLPHQIEAALYFVVAEALTNVARYAQADSAQVSVQLSGGLAVATVRDDGLGGADPAGGTGLRGLQDRVAALDGRLTVESPPGGGTIVRAEIPCAS